MIRAISYSSLLLVALVTAWILLDIFFIGVSALDLSFLTEAPKRSGRLGGINSIIISTAVIVAIATSIALPLSIGAAVFLTFYCEETPRFRSLCRAALDLLAATPSIVFGLFGSAFFCLYLNLGFSLLSGGLTLACMILPLLVRLTEGAICSVPKQHLESGYALGLSKSSIFFRLVVPLIIPAVSSAIILSIARALSETAALLFTSGYVSRMPSSLLDSGRTLSVHIFDLSMNVPGGDKNAYASAVVLLAMIILMNLLTLAIGRAILSRSNG